MIRCLVIAGGDLDPYDESPSDSFAFFDTVTDRFVTVGGAQIFESVADLLACGRADPRADDLPRLLALLPREAL